MKHQMLKKVLSSLMTATLAFSLCACGNAKDIGDASTSAQEESKTSGAAESSVTSSDSSSEEASKETMYPIEGNVTLTLAMVDRSAVTANAKHQFDTPLGKAWQEATGVTIEVIQCANQDALNLLIAGGDLPDLMYWTPGNYSGGAAKAIKDGVIEPLNDYIEEYAPDLNAVLESNDVWRKSNLTSGGQIIGAPFIRGEDFLCTSAGLIIRQDWLDDLGLEVPHTPDELYDVLKAFKEEKGAAIPMTITNTWMKHLVNQGMISSAFDLVRVSWYQIDGEIHLGYAEEQYKDVLVFLNKLYNDGLLDPNYMTNGEDTCRSNMANGISGVTVGASGGMIGNILSAVEETDTTFNLTGFGPLVAKEGDIPYSGQFDNAVKGPALTMTSQCENKEAAIKFMNYGYTEEGSLLLNFGIEGESYTMVDGYPTYTEVITNNSNGWTMQQALAQYTMSWNDGPMVQDRRYMEQYAARPQQQAALAQWSNTTASDYQVPTLSIAEDAKAEYDKLWADIDTYISEMFVQYVTGQASLEGFETEYLSQLEKMGIDRVLELQQEALDTFNVN